MAEYVPLEIPDNPKLAQNIIHFGRALRRAGLPIGPGRVIDAIDAAKAAGFTNQQDFYWTLHACFVNRPEHRAVLRFGRRRGFRVRGVGAMRVHARGVGIPAGGRCSRP